MNILLIAPPAAGKGTQSKKISEKYDLTHISTGDLLREETNEEVNKLLKEGKLVSDELITSLLEKRLRLKDCDKGYILDGYPRNLNQAKLYEDLTKKLNKDNPLVLVLDLDKETSEKRITGRIVCPSCGSVYNDKIKEAYPKITGLCDYCHHTLIKRTDDNKKTFEKRYNTYINETQPLIKYYENQGLVKHIDSSIDVQNTTKQIYSILDNILTRR